MSDRLCETLSETEGQIKRKKPCERERGEKEERVGLGETKRMREEKGEVWREREREREGSKKEERDKVDDALVFF